MKSSILKIFTCLIFGIIVSCDNNNSGGGDREEGNVYDNRDITPPIIRDSLLDSLQAR